jgi:hypothetical protein
VPVLPSDSARPAFSEKEALMPATSEAGGLTGLSMGEPSLLSQKMVRKSLKRDLLHTL